MNQIGQTKIPTSPVVMGLWQAGGCVWGNTNDSDSLQAINTALNNGVYSFDTASAYGQGHSESLLGKALQNKRQRATIASKCILKLDHASVISACEHSLKRLQSDYIDLYYIHWPSGTFDEPLIPISETLDALNTLQKQGKIRAIGLSNFSLEQLIEAQRYAIIDAIQIPYSLAWRKAETNLIPYCQKQKISTFCYSALAGGLLTGKYQAASDFSKQDIRQCLNLTNTHDLNILRHLLEKLNDFAKQYNTTLANIALSWITHQPSLYAIAGARNAQQAQSNAATLQLKLSQDDFAHISELSDKATQHITATELWDLQKARSLKS